MANKSKVYDFYSDLNNIKSAVKDAGEHAKDRANDFIHYSMDEMKERSANFKEGLNGFIQEKPFQSLGVALLAGMLLGKIWRQ